MLINLENGDTVNAELIDDGTLDTVVRLNGIDSSYSQEVAAKYRTANGGFTRGGFVRFVKEVCVPDCY